MLSGVVRRLVGLVEASSELWYIGRDYGSLLRVKTRDGLMKFESVNTAPSELIYIRTSSFSGAYGADVSDGLEIIQRLLAAQNPPKRAFTSNAHETKSGHPM